MERESSGCNKEGIMGVCIGLNKRVRVEEEARGYERTCVGCSVEHNAIPEIHRPLADVLFLYLHRCQDKMIPTHASPSSLAVGRGEGRPKFRLAFESRNAIEEAVRIQRVAGASATIWPRLPSLLRYPTFLSMEEGARGYCRITIPRSQACSGTITDRC